VESRDVVDFGASPGRDRPGRSWPLWLAAVLLAGAVVALIVRNVSGEAGPPAAASPSPTAPPTTAIAIAPGPVFDDSPAVTDLGHPLLGVVGDWELLARGPEGVVRVELARGRVMRTPLPALASGGPVSFVVGRDWVVIRPLDFVEGYLVRDGRPARPLSGALGESGPALPGPDAAHLWVAADSGAGAAMALVTPDGRRAGATVTWPAGGAGYPEPDGTGRLLLHGTGGVYLGGPEGIRRVTTGDLLAAGPTRWLIRECDDRARCATFVVDRRAGTRRSFDLPVEPGPAYVETGVISPDGGHAALLRADANGATVHLLDLVAGADRPIGTPIDRVYGNSTMGFSPDGRWLFIAGAAGLLAVDAATARVHDIGVEFRPIQQVAIRAR
jgi:hypothetical protein